MITIKKPGQPTSLDEAIDEAIRELRTHDAHSEEFKKITDQLTKLYAMKAQDKPARVSKDTLAMIAGNLAGILVIVGYENKHVITSKALSFLPGRNK